MAVGIGVLLIFAGYASACNPLRGFPEAVDTLAPKSRLPRWFGSLLAERTREDVTVRAAFYMPPFSVDDVVVDLVDKNGKVLAHATGKSVEHPFNATQRARSVSTMVFPVWLIVTVNEVMEVVELRAPEPYFYISDDPTLIKSATDFIRSKGGRAR